MEESDRTLVYVDETCFNLFTRRTRGRSQVGRPAVRQLQFTRGRNLNLCLAVAADVGIVYYEIRRGTNTKQDFRNYMDNLDRVLESQAVENCFVIMDNAPIHIDASSFVATVRKIPPYSPFLNPIENCFSTIKLRLREKLREAATVRRIADVPTDTSVSEHRISVLQGIVEEILQDQTISGVKVARMQNHIITYLDRCLNCRDIVV